jgi:Annexin
VSSASTNNQRAAAKQPLHQTAPVQTITAAAKQQHPCNMSAQEEIEAIKQFIAARDADSVKKATSGIGSDEGALASVLCNRTKAQLERLDLCYHAKYGKSLLQMAESEIGGCFGKLVGFALQPLDDLGATLFSLACDGPACDQSMLTDLVCTHTNAELAAITKHWEAKHNGSMLDRLNSELKGDYKTLLVGLLRGSKSESTAVDEALAVDQAKKLHKAGVGKTFGTDEDVFAAVLGSASRAQIQVTTATII